MLEPLLSERLDSVSQTSGKRSRSCISTSRHSSLSSARRKALAEAAAAKQEAEFDRLLAEKERERMEMEAEEERRRQAHLAKFVHDKAVLAVNKKATIAEAKLKAIKQAIEDEEDDKITLVTIPGVTKPVDTIVQTQAWINKQENPQETLKTLDCVTGNTNPFEECFEGQDDNARQHSTPPIKEECTPKTSPNRNISEYGQARNTPLYEPRSVNPFTPTPVEELMTINQKLAASLERQSLPKCHPEIFAGDVTHFHPWESAFRAIIKDANLSPEKEINYLRSYTKGDAQKVVNNFRQQQYRDPVVALRDVWTELERHFGNTAAITNVLVQRLQNTSKFEQGDSDKLQRFADVCADVDSQLDFLPGLRCLNYPSTIGPIVENLPNFIHSKWEKRVVQYAEDHNDAYPGFKEFAAIIQEQARLKNHPNVLACTQSNNHKRRT